MSSPKSPGGGTLPPEPPELAAERERLLAELLKQAKTATGPTQTVLRKLHEVVTQLRPGVPVNPQVYVDAKVAFEQFSKAPVASPPAVIMQSIDFMQKRAAAMGATGTAPPARSAPPPPPSPPTASAPARGLPPRRNTMDGFEMPKRTVSSVALNPASTLPLPASQGKKPEPQPGASAAQPKNAGAGKVRG